MKSTPNSFSKFLTPRKKQTHKGTYGHVFGIGGSEDKPGAALLSAFSAIAAGAGRSTLCLPKSAFGHVNPDQLEIMYAPIEDKKLGFLSKTNLKTILKIIKPATVVWIGPGMGTHPSTVQLVCDLIQKISCPLILDADALNALQGKASVLLKRKGPTVLTPHPTEMARLIGKTTAFVQKNRKVVATQFAKKFKVTLVLKGHQTLIAEPTGKIGVNPTGNPGMASAGQGDVLTGILAGLWAQFPNENNVIPFGVYLHGKVGDRLLAQGHRVIRASTIAKNLHLGYGGR